MKAAVTVDLYGATFVLDEGAFLALRSYLDRAAARLRRHPDRAEVIAGLERSIAAKLARRPAAHGTTLDHADMLAALNEVGPVDGPEIGGTQPDDARLGASQPRYAQRPRGEPGRREADGPEIGGAGRVNRERSRRRLYRLREGQQIAGVCAGLAAFGDVEVHFIRLGFILGTVFSGGALLAGYVVLMFVMPLARTEAEIAEARGGLPAG